jgi:[lysine-biosynthesis-protein LysW]---L-2-aminoadipate ligase
VSRSTVALLASQLRTDERRLVGALERQGLRWLHLDTRTVHSGPTGTAAGYGGVLNREIGQTRARYAARTFEAHGVPVLNNAAATETCADKWQGTLALAGAGLPVPRTELALTPQAALDALERLGYPALIKPLVGSWGRLVVELTDRRAATAVLEYVAALPAPQSRIVYVQELIAKPGRDIRAIVVGGTLLGATYRIAAGTVTNVARGARTEVCPPTAELTDLAVRAAAAVGADIAGVDLIEDVDGRLLVLEVNTRVEFGGFQAAHGDRVDVAGAIAALVAERAARW